jgi:hypothetical protein
MRGILQDGAIPLNSGAYGSRSLIADAQKCINLYPEANPQETDPGAAVTHYPRPGFLPLGNGPGAAARGRGVFTASNGNLYAIVGQNVYYIDRNWTFVLLGQIGAALTPVSLADNGNTAVIVDGSAKGYSFDLASNTWNGAINDGTGTFLGSVRADYVDTFLTFATPGTNQWNCTLGGQLAWNALQVGAKDSFPDNIVTHAVNLRQVWLIGLLTTEIWYLSGAIPFPFEEWPNTFVPYGCAAAYSLARGDNNLFWLSRNKDGECIVVQTNGYAVEAISTRALEYRFTNYQTVQDAIAYFYQQGGHSFYVLHFPTADESWGYDLSTKQWHQRVSIDANGVFHRERVAFHAFVSNQNGYPNTNVGQDWATGQIYAIDQKTYTDNGMAIPFVRSFPHVTDSLHEITGGSFVADISTGSLLNTAEIEQDSRPWSNGWSNGFGPLIVLGAPQVAMRSSKDGGATWGNYRNKGLVSAGHYRSMMRWRGIGMGRDLVFEVSTAAPMEWALQGAYLEPIRHGA